MSFSFSPKARALARGTPASVLGDLLGEHVVVLHSGQADLIHWLENEFERKAARVLGEVHFTLRSRELSRFGEAFPETRFLVRPPNLDRSFSRPRGRALRQGRCAMNRVRRTPGDRRLAIDGGASSQPAGVP